MKITKLLQILFAFALLFNISCSSDSSETAQEMFYGNGVLIANEGNFGTPNADVTYVTSNFSAKQDKIYSANNNGENLGDVLQTIGFNGNGAYLLLNNSNKIQVVNRYTFKKAAEITEQIKSPRYMAFAKNYIYVTNDTYNGDKYVSVYNANTLSFVKKIMFTTTVERIVEAGGNIFVQNASYGFGNTITKINTTTNEIDGQPIALTSGNINKTISNGTNVYVITSGTTDSYIYQISSTGNIVKTTTLTGIANATNLEVDGGKFYFSSANKIYAMDMTATTTPTAPIITAVDGGQYYTLYGFSVLNGRIFTSDVKSFTQDSEITVYTTSGSKIGSFTAGKGANGFYLN
ncbi:hypothetical protein [Chryseobacterium gwangjuense]|uniref:hypothetical protein n=1 Tax=Chryseobacterium gwangjuense TaxID=1069980 RepID=UPI001E51CAE5|nr:hypothetical protein [Chryseobacterium gwangjuense]MCE3076474.1 hypothetical protein [Chryseobacterium gwangjuense]